NNRRMQVELESLNDRPAADGTLFRVGENNLELICLDGFWEDVDETIVESETGGLANGDTLTINNASDVESFPIIRVVTVSDNPEFSILNQETGSLVRVSTAAFVSGTEIIISSIDGTIYL